MVAGDAFERIEPVFRTLTAKNGYVYLGDAEAETAARCRRGALSVLGLQLL